VNLPDSDAVYTKYRCLYVCLVFNRQRTDDAFARQFVFAQSASVAKRIRVSSAARQSYVAGLCGAIGRGFRGARSVRRREYLILYAAEPMRWPAVRLECRVLLAEIEYVQSRAVKGSAGPSRAEYA